MNNPSSYLTMRARPGCVGGYVLVSAALMVGLTLSGCSDSSTGSHNGGVDVGTGDVYTGNDSADPPDDTGVEPGDTGNVDPCPDGTSCGVQCKNAADCDDFDPCTTDQCSATGTCAHTPNGTCTPECTADGECDDGDLCTQDQCGPENTCSHTTIVGCGDPECTENADCNDDNFCTDDRCSTGSVCVFVPNTAPCDDGDDCTDFDQCRGGHCVATQASSKPECQWKPPTCDAICQLAGEIGTEVECSFRIVTDSADGPRGTALQFLATYDAERVTFINFFDEHCFGGAGCFDVPTNGENSLTLTTGHSVAISPPAPETWAGEGAVILVNLADPTLAITAAYLTADGSVEGDAMFMRGRFKLLATVGKAEAVDVCLSKTLAADGAATSLPTIIKDLLIVTSTP